MADEKEDRVDVITVEQLVEMFKEYEKEEAERLAELDRLADEKPTPTKH